MTNIQDKRWVRLARQGDKHAFDRLVSKYHGKVLQVLHRYVADPGEAEDLLQETFVRAYLALSNFRGQSEFYTWLYRIAINTAKNYLVFTHRRPPPIDIDMDFTERILGRGLVKDIDTPENLLLQSELAELVSIALNELSDELRTTFLLREIEGLTYEEIALIQACPVGTVRSRIFRAREMLHQLVQDYFSDPR